MESSTNYTGQAFASQRHHDKQSNVPDLPPNSNMAARDTVQRHASQTRVSGQSHGTRRRNRLITSCIGCRQRKMRCDRLTPCTQCQRLNKECLYLPKGDDAHQKLADIKEKMDALERKMEFEAQSQASLNINRSTEAARLDPAIDTGAESDDGDAAFHKDEETLEPTPLAALDNVYEATGDDELVDCGVQMGKLRFSERIGGWIRPKLVDEISDTLADIRLGKSRHSTSPQSNDHLELRRDRRKIQATPISYVGPGPDYIAPAPDFFFTGSARHAAMIDYLPPKTSTDLLISQYWKAVHYLCKVVHRPSFEAQYVVFWNNISHGREPIPSVQAIIFAALFSAAVSLTDEQSYRYFSEAREVLMGRLRAGTEVALAKANVLRTTKVDTIQAFTMYLIPFARAEVSRAHSALVGAAIRLAECLGLHRDGTFYGMSPVEVQVRRMIWHQLCFLDYRTGEAVGPRPQIRRDDYDTRMPWNVDDIDLMGPSPVTKDKSTWTDMTFMLMRAECCEMKRQVWFDVIAVDKKKKSITSLLIKIQKFRTAMETRFESMIDRTSPFQHLAHLTLEMQTKGLQVQALHRYLFTTTQKMPDRLRQILIDGCLTHMESAIQFEKHPDMQLWSWYRGAFNQYHTALLLIVEVYAYPMRKEAGRIWACLDYVFEVPAHLAPKDKAEIILADLQESMTTYERMRKVKMSTSLEQKVRGMSKSFAIAVEGANDIVDQHGQMQHKQTTIPATYGALGAYSDGPGALGQDQDPDIQMSIMQDIDWNELSQYYDQTGDLDVADFDMTLFTGQALQPTTNLSIPLAPALHTAPAPDVTGYDYMYSSVNFSEPPTTMQNQSFVDRTVLPSQEDLSDVNFTSPPLFADRPGQHKQTHFG